MPVDPRRGTSRPQPRPGRAHGWQLGIDFGTSNTSAAQRDAHTGTVEALPLTHQSNLLPSGVFISEDTTCVGHAAINLADARPDAYLSSPKRTIGQERVFLGGRDLPVEEVIAPVIEDVLTRAVERHGGETPAKVVLTHPEAWSTINLRTLIRAAEKAGVDRHTLHLVSEPRAAVYCYSHNARPLPGELFGVFDFGAGTLDVAILAAEAGGRYRMVAADGDNTLGGRSIDAHIRAWVDRQLENDNPRLHAYLQGEPATSVTYDLDNSIRQAKEVLSEAPSASITITAAGERMSILLTRGEFENLIAKDIRQAANLVAGALASAKVPDPSRVRMYLTGGSSRIPLVHRLIGEVAHIATLDDPKTVVSRGALLGPAISAEEIMGDRRPDPRGGSAPVPPARANRPAPTPGDGRRPGPGTNGQFRPAPPIGPGPRPGPDISGQLRRPAGVPGARPPVARPNGLPAGMPPPFVGSPPPPQRQALRRQAPPEQGVPGYLIAISAIVAIFLVLIVIITVTG